MNENIGINSKAVHVLVVDDEDPILKLINNQVQKLGYECSVTNNARDALKIIEKNSIDVIITDLKMPEMDGLELIKIIKEKYDSNVIAMTGYVEEYLYEDLIDLGVDDFIQKPFSQKEISARLKRVLRERNLVSTLKTTQKALKKSEERFRNFLDNLGDTPYMTDALGNITYTNKSAEKITGLPVKDIIDKPFQPLFTKESQGLANDLFQRTLKGESPEFELTFTNGKTGHFKNEPLIDQEGNIIGLFGIVRDITERKNTEKMLMEYQRAVDASKNLIAVVDNQYRYRMVNQMFLKQQNASQDQIIGHSVEEILGKEAFENSVKSNLEKCFKGNDISYDMEIIYPQLGKRSLEVNYYPLKDSEGNVTRIVSIIRDITSRKQAEKTLRDSEIRYRALVEDMPALICRFLTEGTLTFVNKAYCQYFQKDPNEITGQNFFLFIPEDHRKSVKDKFASLTKENPTITYEHKVVAPNGEIRWQRWTDHALFENGNKLIEYQSIGFDMTDRKKIETSLKFERQQLLSIFDSIGESIYVADPETYEILFANKHLINLFNRKLIGEICYQAFQNLSAPCNFCTNKRIIENKGAPYQWEYYNPSVDKHFMITDRIIKWPDGRDVRFELAIDNTNRKKAELETKKLIIDLERSNKELDDFAYTVSHDLKEPLRGMRNTIAFLIEDHKDKITEDSQKRLNTLIDLCNRQEHLIESVLHYSRVGRLDLSLEKIDLDQLVHDIINSLKTQFEEEEAVEFRIPIKLPNILCDKIRINEVFNNLITNAIKYNRNSLKWVEIGYDEPEKEQFVFYVKDNGIGIREKHYGKIFEIFRRLHSEDQYGGGSGSGLTIVKKIVERHQGRIWLESTYNEGTTFYFTLQGENHAAH